MQFSDTAAGLESAKFGFGFSRPTGWARSVQNGERGEVPSVEVLQIFSSGGTRSGRSLAGGLDFADIDVGGNRTHNQVDRHDHPELPFFPE
jgi:hypothetical protein